MEAQPMRTAPRDRHILIQTEVLHFHFRAREYRPDGRTWVEAVWREEEHGTPAGFHEWCGNDETRSTTVLRPLMWAELPTTGVA